MPLRWKIFRIANYFLLLVCLTITGAGTYFFVVGNSSGSDVFEYLVFILGGLALICNFSVNIFLLERYYPDGELQKPMLIFISMSLLFSSITIAFLSIIYAVEFHDTVISPRYNDDSLNRAVIFSLSFGMILLITYYVIWMQVALRKTINRNRRSLYSSFLESK